jgi:anthranilate synthase component 2
MHGKPSDIALDTDCPLFHGMSGVIQGARYHSLAAVEGTMPPELEITARTDDGEIMAVRRRGTETYGVQFHPESILTPDGKQILINFLERREDK